MDNGAIGDRRLLAEWIAKGRHVELCLCIGVIRCSKELMQGIGVIAKESIHMLTFAQQSSILAEIYDAKLGMFQMLTGEFRREVARDVPTLKT